MLGYYSECWNQYLITGMCLYQFNPLVTAGGRHYDEHIHIFYKTMLYEMMLNVISS